MAKEVQLSKEKQWAKDNYKGMASLIFPSFTPDFKDIDEDGIRLDVQNSIKHGFVSLMSFPVGTNPATHRKFSDILCDEAKGTKLLAGDIVGEKTEKADLEHIAACEKNGCTHLLIHPDASGIGRSEDEIYEIYRKRIEATSLPVWIFAMESWYYRPFGPSGVPLNVFDRLADLPNVVGVKLSHPLAVGTAFACAERLGDRLLVSPVNFELMAGFRKHYNIQCSGQWSVEAIQSPEKPYAVQMMNLLLEDKYDEALKVYTKIQPALNDFFWLQAPCILKHTSPWQHRKYIQWCVGGNGGLMYIDAPLYKHYNVPTLDQAARNHIKAWFRKIGIEPTSAPDEEFMVGKAAYARGVRVKDLKAIQYYSVD
ncbi:MAG: dihydrodipicolinate synthase family protein [Desulfobacteraceae bacterium]|nr:dihydrodipicolinate synthase family protein [Desulfobacteraceae bacterium]